MVFHIWCSICGPYNGLPKPNSFWFSTQQCMWCKEKLHDPWPYDMHGSFRIYTYDPWFQIIDIMGIILIDSHQQQQPKKKKKQDWLPGCEGYDLRVKIAQIWKNFTIQKNKIWKNFEEWYMCGRAIRPTIWKYGPHFYNLHIQGCILGYPLVEGCTITCHIMCASAFLIK